MLPPFGKSWPKLPSCSDLVSLCAFERASRPDLILHPERIVGKQEVIRFLPVCPSCSHNLKNHARDHRHRVVNPWERAANRRLGTLREREKRWLLVLLCYKYHNRLLQQNGQQESCERRILAN